jgi:hypothetical protein
MRGPAPGRARWEFHYTAPSFLAPNRVQFKYRLEGFDPDWVPELLHMTRKQDIERLEPITALFSEVKFGQRAHHCGTADRDTPDGRETLERQGLRWQAQRTADNADPRLSNPIVIFTFEVTRVS